jgi:hypothetical protein
MLPPAATGARVCVCGGVRLIRFDCLEPRGRPWASGLLPRMPPAIGHWPWHVGRPRRRQIALADSKGRSWPGLPQPPPLPVRSPSDPPQPTHLDDFSCPVCLFRNCMLGDSIHSFSRRSSCRTSTPSPRPPFAPSSPRPARTVPASSPCSTRPAPPHNNTRPLQHPGPSRPHTPPPPPPRASTKQGRVWARGRGRGG